MKYVTTIDDHKFEIEITKDGGLIVNGEPRSVDFLALGPAFYSILAQGVSHEIVLEEQDDQIEVLMRGRRYNVQVLDERALLLAARRGGFSDTSGEYTLKSPMPGLIVDVPVIEGQEVKKGQTLIILESMKMQNELKAPRDGVVARVSVAKGQSVELSKPLLTLT